MPYFNAEADHLAKLAKLDKEIAELDDLLDCAKDRYRDALCALETLNESVHRQRCTS